LFGLGVPTQLQIPGEARGLVPDPAWKQQRFGEPWYLGNTYHFGIGQGDLLVSPVQVAQMMQAVANEGRLCQLSVLSHQPERCKDLGVSRENLTLVKQGLLDACSPSGTAYPFFAHNAARRTGVSVEQDLHNGAIACKTGTAEFGGADSRGYRKTHGWFVMAVGIDRQQLGATPVATSSAQPSPASSALPLAGSAPQDLNELRTRWIEQVQEHGFPNEVVIAVLVESDDTKPFKEGSSDAAPVAQSIVNWMLDQASTPLPSLTTQNATDDVILAE
jgi:penicillin-binding protein 2